MHEMHENRPFISVRKCTEITGDTGNEIGRLRNTM